MTNLISKAEGDAPEYIELIRHSVLGALKASQVEAVYVTRIDNWFDRKWLRFSGNQVVSQGMEIGGRFEVALEACSQGRLTMPPFSPNRVVEWSYYYWNGYADEFILRAGKHVPSLRQRSNQNLGRRVAEMGSSVGFVWYTGNTLKNGRGSLMFYSAKQGDTQAWFATFAKGEHWKLQSTTSIAKDDLLEYAKKGRVLTLNRQNRVLPEEEALSRELHRAIEAEDLIQVSKFIGDEINIEGRDQRGRTALLHALYDGSWDCANFLLKAGANPFEQDYSGLGALHACSWENDQGPDDANTMRTLIDLNVDLESRTSSGATPLMYAAGWGTTDLASILIEAGAKLESAANSRKTALHVACRRSNTRLSELLIEQGAKVGARDNSRRTPLFHAVLSKDLGAIRLLHKAGASLTLKDKFEWTPLSLAKAMGSADVVQLLTELIDSL